MGKAVYTEREKARYVAEWQASGQSAAGFAASKGIKETTFYTWSAQAKKRAQGGDSPSFDELPVRARQFARDEPAAAGTGSGRYFIRAQGIWKVYY